ncbi:MAG: hypothetical protein ACKVOW_00360 [Chitinophagaceae bacterium]
MLSFLSELKKRNKPLFVFGCVCLTGVVYCMMKYQQDLTFVAGINAWIKPLKFFLSVVLFSWTMAWYLFYLKEQAKVRIYSWMVIIVMIFELAIIVWQASNGRLSHFNISTPFYSYLFMAMGVAIVLLTTWTLYIGFLFFKQKSFPISETYLWGIRLGILLFVIFSFEGGIMAQRLAHTVGNVDGSPGLPLLNWSKQYGDLRVSHFFGLHALQLLPLVGYYLCTKKWQIFLFSSLYMVFVLVSLIQAFYKIPFIN